MIEVFEAVLLDEIHDRLTDRRWYMTTGRAVYAEEWRKERLHDLRVETIALVQVLRRTRERLPIPDELAVTA